jgi:hypothetical protein
MLNSIETRLWALKTILECPITALQSWSAYSFQNLSLDLISTSIPGFTDPRLKTLLSFDVPLNKSLFLTEIFGEPNAESNTIPDFDFFSRLFAFFSLGETIKTPIKPIGAYIFQTTPFLTFESGKTVTFNLISDGPPPTYYGRDWYLTIRLTGFLVDGNLSERLKTIETYFN